MRKLRQSTLYPDQKDREVSEEGFEPRLLALKSSREAKRSGIIYLHIQPWRKVHGCGNITSGTEERLELGTRGGPAVTAEFQQPFLLPEGQLAHQMPTPWPRKRPGDVRPSPQESGWSEWPS